MRKYNEDYAGFVNPPDAAYPNGSPKNATTDTAEDGTPVEEKWVGDVWGFFQSIITEAGETPNGQTESAANPQILSALIKRMAWLGVPIGAEMAFDSPPPTDDPRFRFVKLTADDAYNGSLLDSKAISGTAPNLVVKMTVNSTKSPINGQEIFMLNTMEANRRPSESPGSVIQDASRQISGTVSVGYNSRQNFSGISGAFTQDTNGIYATNSPSGLSGPTRLLFDSSRVVPTAPRNEVFAVTEVRYKRIY